MALTLAEIPRPEKVISSMCTDVASDAWRDPRCKKRTICVSSENDDFDVV